MLEYKDKKCVWYHQGAELTSLQTNMKVHPEL